MPAELLFDLSSIDLSTRMLDRDQIARYNPHRGLLALLDAIIWHDEAASRGVAIMQIRDDEFWCDGHIPGHPLMPGVLMIEAAAQLSSVLYYKRSGKTWFAGFTRIEDVAFRGPVKPGDTLYLLANEIKYNIKRFITQVQGIVRGQIVFDGRLTGMAFPNMGQVREPIAEDLAEALQKGQHTGSQAPAEATPR